MTVVWAYTKPCPAMIACEVKFVEQRAGGSQGSSVWLVQHVLHRLCSNEQTLFHPFSLVGCLGCCELSFFLSIALRLVQKVSNSGDMTLEKITILLSGMCIS